jgi:tetratricopeptide (TPR) repeat protein
VNQDITIVTYATEIELKTEENGTLLHRIGHAIEHEGDYNLAYSIYSKAYEMRKEVLGYENPDVGTTLNNLGVVTKKIGRYKDAERTLRAALQIREATLGSNHVDVAQSLQNIAITISQMGRFKEAEGLLQRALEIYSSSDEECDDGMAYCLSNLASHRHHNDRHREALELINRAIAIRERSPYKLFDPAYAGLYRDRGILLSDFEQFPQAIASIEKALEMLDAIAGKGNGDYIRCLCVFGTVLSKSGDNNRAQLVFLSAIRIAEEILGRENPIYAEALNNYALSLDRTNPQSVETCKELLRTAIDVQSRINGSSSLLVTTTKNNLAYTLMINREYKAAIAMYREVLASRIRIFSRYHNDVAVVYANLGACFEWLQRDETCGMYYGEAIAIYCRLEFPANEDCRSLLNRASMFFGRNGDFVTAKLLQRIASRRFSSHNQDCDSQSFSDATK